MTVDGKPFSIKGGSATRLDFGAHKVHAIAAGYAPLDQTVTLPPKGGVVVVDLVLVEAQQAGAALPSDAPPPSRAPWIAAFSIGGAGLVVGIATGAAFVSQLASLKASCPGNRCPASDQSRGQSISTLGNVSTVGLVVGGVGVVAGGIVLLTRLRTKPSTTPHTTEGTTHAPAAPSSGLQAVALGFTPGGVSVGGWF